MSIRLEITDRFNDLPPHGGCNAVVVVDGEERRIQHEPYRILMKLAVARLAGDGWIFKDDLCFDEQDFARAMKYVYRVRVQLGRKIQIENNRKGYYRLGLEPSEIRIAK